VHLVPEHEDTPAMTAAPQARSGRRRGLRVTGLVAVSALALAGCQGQVSNGFMPQSISDSGDRVTNLWVGSWIAVLGVGVITWGLMLYAAVRFRRRKGDDPPLRPMSNIQNRHCS